MQLVGKVDRILSAQSYLDQAGELSIQGLAQACGMSRFQLQRRFKKETGLSLLDFIAVQRLDAAAAYVRLTNQPLLDVAIGMGYCGQQSFTRAFTRRWGISPQQMRLSAKAAYAGFFASPTDPSIPQRIVHWDAPRRLWFKRYTGPYANVPGHWAKFKEELAGLAQCAKPPYYGLIYDDPDITPPQRIRYGCAIEAPANASAAPEGWLELDVVPSRFVVFSIHCSYQEGAVRLRPRVLSWFAAQREIFGTAGVYELYEELPSDEHRARAMQLHISLAN
ncbi:helix-turn-helix domain-containing protein [Massilia sp. MB5]|uniref:helix-turn-helix domain-containing protein n=1 Tax=Massilia sp. MB5 TaxID=2919578 RepID=UPI001F0F660E|nr:helix-turn-helix domain-containing protein [Massilia sp. MB5]UMR28857.1 helix-turn-helix domain-containing protein [Massilia sp. MB5]